MSRARTEPRAPLPPPRSADQGLPSGRGGAPDHPSGPAGPGAAEPAAQAAPVGHAVLVRRQPPRLGHLRQGGPRRPGRGLWAPAPRAGHGPRPGHGRPLQHGHAARGAGAAAPGRRPHQWPHACGRRRPRVALLQPRQPHWAGAGGGQRRGGPLLWAARERQREPPAQADGHQALALRGQPEHCGQHQPRLPAMAGPAGRRTGRRCVGGLPPAA
jgi:hypothetical protein